MSKAEEKLLKAVEDYFFERYENKITVSQSWVIPFAADFHQQQRRKDLIKYEVWSEKNKFKNADFVEAEDEVDEYLNQKPDAE